MRVAGKKEKMSDDKYGYYAPLCMLPYMVYVDCEASAAWISKAFPHDIFEIHEWNSIWFLTKWSADYKAPEWFVKFATVTDGMIRR